MELNDEDQLSDGEKYHLWATSGSVAEDIAGLFKAIWLSIKKLFYGTKRD